MSWVEVLLIVAFFIVWTLLIGFVSERAGQEREKKRQENNNSSSNSVYNVNVGPLAEDLEAVAERVSSLERQVQEIRDTPQHVHAADISPEVQRSLEARMQELEERDQAYRDRFTRVERKAGMRV